MRATFIAPSNLKEEILEKIFIVLKNYFPLLIKTKQIIRDDNLMNMIEVEEQDRYVNNKIKLHNLQNDLVFIFRGGPCFWADEMVTSIAGMLEGYNQEKKFFKENPQVGAIIFLYNIKKDFREDEKYLAKVCAQIILNYFGVGDHKNCFFLTKRAEAREDCVKEFCGECLYLMSKIDEKSMKLYFKTMQVKPA